MTDATNGPREDSTDKEPVNIAKVLSIVAIVLGYLVIVWGWVVTYTAERMIQELQLRHLP